MKIVLIQHRQNYQIVNVKHVVILPINLQVYVVHMELDIIINLKHVKD